MKLSKACPAAALAALAVLAITGTASAQHEVVLCKALEELCDGDSRWPKGTEILVLAEDPELVGTLPIVCEDSTVRGKVTSPYGVGSPLEGSLEAVAFGVLPTPALGKGCESSVCGAGIEIHPNELPFTALLSVTEKDKYTFSVVGKTTVVCSGFTCGFAADKNDIAPISHTGEHPLHDGDNLPVIEIDYTLSRTLGLAFFCGNTALWNADYVVYLAHHGEDTSLVWPSLGTFEPDEVVLCKELVEATALCPEGEFYPSGTKLLALAEGPEFKASPFSALKCEDSVIEAESTESMDFALDIEIAKIAFGKLPTPTLGEGCTTCTKGIHPPPAISGSIEMQNDEDYVFKSSEAFELLSCFGLGITCLYGSDGLESLVDSDAGKHKLAIEEEGLAQILVAGALHFIKGSNFCPEEGIWTANYVVYALESEGKAAQGWLALYDALEG